MADEQPSATGDIEQQQLTALDETALDKIAVDVVLIDPVRLHVDEQHRPHVRTAAPAHADANTASIRWPDELPERRHPPVWEDVSMRTTRALGLTLLLVGVTACGGDDDAADAPSETVAAGDDSSGSDDDDGGGGSGGDVVDPQPAGQALVSVDGREFTLTEPGALDCTLADDSITFSFRIGDNEVTLGAGSNRTDDEWYGSVDVRIANPSGEAGPIAYFPELPANSSGMVVDDNSFSYSGPMLKQPPNDGSNPPPVDVGEGIISITCP